MARRDEQALGEGGGVLGRLVLLAALAGVGAYVVGRLRERHLDGVIWEEPPAR